MTKQEIQEKVNAFLTDRLEYEPSAIKPETELKRDIGITSVDAVAIALFAQKTFGCAIDMREVKAIVTLDDLYNYIEQNQ